MSPPSLTFPFSRRGFLANGAKLSALSVALLAGLSSRAHAVVSGPVTQQDIDVLNVILGTEQEGIAAYQVFMDRHLLQKDGLKLATLIQSQHETHRDVLAAIIRRLGGTPVTARTEKEYAAALDIDKIEDQAAALKLATVLERGAANAYIGMMPSTHDSEIAKTAGRIAADEVMHWTALVTMLHEPLPLKAMSFGT